MSSTTEPLRILLVEDSDSDAKLVMHALRSLRRETNVHRVQDADGVRDALATRGFDVILSDWSMPGFSAMGALRILQESGLDLPFIIVSGTIGEELAVDAMRAGAHDYILKDKLARLAPAIEREVRESLVRAGRAAVVEELRASEARYRRIIETTNEGVWMIDTELRTTFINGRMTEMLRRPCAEIVGRPATDLVDEASREVMAKVIAQHRRSNGGVSQFEVGLRCADGTTLWALLDSTPLRDASGHYEGVLAMVMNITSRKEAEAARRTAEARFRALWDSGVILITITDVDGRITDMNEAGARLLGYDRDELLTTRPTFEELTPPKWRRADEQARRQLGRESGAVAWQKELLRSDGTSVPVLIAATFAGGREGVSIAVDLTEQKRAEATLSKRARVAGVTTDVAIALSAGQTQRGALQRCVEGIVEHLGAAVAWIWLFDADRTHLEMQAGAGLSLPSEDKHARFRIGEHTIGRIARDKVAYVTNDAQSDPRFVEKDWFVREKLTSFAGFPLVVAGNLVGVVALCSGEPIDEVMVDGLGAVADTLAIGIQRRHVERINSGLEVQLRQAQKMEAIGRLAGGVAHDFNNLLSVILSYGQLLYEDLEPGNLAREDLGEINNAAMRAADLTRQLLMFSRQQVLEPKVVDLNELIIGMDKMLRRIVGEDVELALDAESALDLVFVDNGSIEQVVMNLVVNARDAMLTGGKLTITTKNVFLDDTYAKEHVGVTPGPHVMLSVRDTGIGMDAATREHIFEPFFTTKDKSKGTGLGLSTVFGIVEQSGGTIWVDSAPGAGSTFCVYLPRATEDAPIERAHVSTAPRDGSETILVVEDEDQVRVVAAGILRKHGYVVLEASNATTAIAVAAAHSGPIDLLLTDVVMPQMSGPELAKRLSPTRPAMKVLCMSGYTDDSIIHHGVLVAEIALLQKPLMPATLTTKVREVLDT